jgi:hypothetical protein
MTICALIICIYNCNLVIDTQTNSYMNKSLIQLSRYRILKCFLIIVIANSILGLNAFSLLSPLVIDNTSGSLYEIFPNQNSGYVSIDLMQSSAPYQYKIFDLRGKLMDSGTLHKSNCQIKLPPASGMYFIAIADQNRMAYTKVSKL